MTPPQYYFPYFFKDTEFDKTLKPFGLSTYIVFDSKTKMPESLMLSKYQPGKLQGPRSTLLTIPFGVTLMVQNDSLFYWKTDSDIIDIFQVTLTNLADVQIIKTFKVNLLQFSLGHNKIDTGLDLNYFVTYVRKEDLKYNQDFYDKFVIVVINKNDINIIPFDWFNEKGGDYGYVWPATAKLDKEKNKLYGQGMRMTDFIIDLNKDYL